MTFERYFSEQITKIQECLREDGVWRAPAVHEATDLRTKLWGVLDFACAFGIVVAEDRKGYRDRIAELLTTCDWRIE